MIRESDVEYFARLVKLSNRGSIKWSSLTSGHNMPSMQSLAMSPGSSIAISSK
jgi:hypothetical protein